MDKTVRQVKDRARVMLICLTRASHWATKEINLNKSMVAHSYRTARPNGLKYIIICALSWVNPMENEGRIKPRRFK